MEVRRMLKDKTALIKDLERLYTLSDEKPNLEQLQTLSAEELQEVVGGQALGHESECQKLSEEELQGVVGGTGGGGADSF